MKTRGTDSGSGLTIQVTLSTSLIWVFAILLIIAAPTNAKKAPEPDRTGFQPDKAVVAGSITALGELSSHIGFAERRHDGYA